MRWFFGLFILIVSFFAVDRVLYYLADTFSPKRLIFSYSPNPSWDTEELSEGEKQELERILSQKFRYLAKGKQCFAFCSEDNKYVLKFFKCDRLQPSSILKALSSIPCFRSCYKRESERKNARTHKLFSSCLLAFEELKEETGMVYLHLNRTSVLTKKVTLSDKIGRYHTLNLDDHPFLVQRKAENIYPLFQELISRGQIDEAKELIDRLFALLVMRHQKGIFDNDPTLYNNTGFVDHQPIHMDVGRFSKNDYFAVPQHAKQEIYNIMEDFRVWMNAFSSDLNQYIEQKLALL